MALFTCKTNYLIKGFPSYGNGNSTLKPEGIVIHDTAGMSSALQEAQRLQSEAQYNNGIAHYYVDENEGYQLIADNIKAYHAGDGSTGYGNGKTLSIEVCRSLSSGDFKNSSDKERYLKALDNAYKVASDLCKQYNINPNNIHQHREFSSTACPYTQKVVFGSYEKALSNAKTKVNSYLGNTSTNTPGYSTNLSWAECDKLTSTTTGKEVQKVRISGSYPSGSQTFGHVKQDVNSTKVLFTEKSSYDGYLVGSSDSIVWVKITSIKGTKGEVIYLDLNQKGVKNFYSSTTVNKI